MLSPEIWEPFYDYLDWSNDGKAWADMGLVADAPPEAVNAYAVFQKTEQERAESGSNEEIW